VKKERKKRRSKIATHDPMLTDPTKGIKQAVVELCGAKVPFYLSTFLFCFPWEPKSG